MHRMEFANNAFSAQGDLQNVFSPETCEVFKDLTGLASCKQFGITCQQVTSHDLSQNARHLSGLHNLKLNTLANLHSQTLLFYK